MVDDIFKNVLGNITDAIDVLPKINEKEVVTNEDYSKCLTYIDKHWKKLTFYHPQDEGIYIGLPNPFVAPSAGRFSRDQFYWDSYFIIVGLLESDKVDLAKGMVENFMYLYERFHVIPQRNRLYNLGISQPPFFTSMVLGVYEKTGDKEWLKRAAHIAADELEHYWMNAEEDKKTKKEIRSVHQGLSRYCDCYVNNETAEHASGWDMTSRFSNKCLNFLPIDLNSCLYKYEKDLEAIYKILKNEKKSARFKTMAAKRKKAINDLMWNERKGFFFDFDYLENDSSEFYSLAGFYPLWAGLADEVQAEAVRQNLKKFEFKGGLANTQCRNISKEGKQWDCPNGWANQQWIAVKGLLNYGFYDDAKRIATKWLNLNKEVFDSTGKFWEKYDVIKYDKGASERYPIQTGFGWTNAIFVKMVREFYDK